MDENPSRVTPVILSGGSGTRLWPLSRRQRPKQSLALTGSETMYQLTLARVSAPGQFDPPIIVANRDDLAWLDRQTRRRKPRALVLEPVPRNTAAAIALAALQVPEDAILLVLPSDHIIGDPDGFRAAVARALPVAATGWIVTFGMKAERPETGFGYIKRGQSLAEGVFEVETFVEKPDHAKAIEFCRSGIYDWNGGIFMFRASTMLEAFSNYAPDVLDGVRDAVQRQEVDGIIRRPDSEKFESVRSVSIDHAVMERAKCIATVPVSIGWSDVGSWDALFDACSKGDDGNFVEGPAILLNSSDCFVRSEGTAVAVVGATDLIVVCTPDCILVAKRGESQHVKEVVQELKAAGRPDLL